jgi:hypothetical protein
MIHTGVKSDLGATSPEKCKEPLKEARRMIAPSALQKANVVRARNTAERTISREKEVTPSVGVSDRKGVG